MVTNRLAFPRLASGRWQQSVLARWWARLLGWQREALTVILVLTAVTCLFNYEIVFLGRTLLPLATPGVLGTRGPYGYDLPFRQDLYHLDSGASAWQNEPWARKIGAEYAAGHLPLWNDDQGFGSPLLANAISGALDPLRLPLFISGSTLAWDLYYLLRTLFGALACYLFARIVGLAVPARYFLAIAYVFSGHFLLLGNNLWIEAYFLLPVLLLGTELLLRGRRRLGFASVALAVALTLLGGIPEVSLAVLLFAAAYGGWYLLELAFRSRDLRRWGTTALWLIGAWLVGIAFAAPLLLTLMEYVQASSAVVERREAFGLGYAPLANASVWFMPYLTGTPTYISDLIQVLPNELLYATRTYVGAVVIVLALYGLYPTRAEPYRRLMPFLALATALLLAKTYGVPGINELGRLPGLNVTHFQIWFSPITGFCFALLASLGVHALSVQPTRPILAAAAVILFGWFVGIGVYKNWATIARIPAHYVWFALGVAAVFATAIWMATQLLPMSPRSWRGVACCALVAGELFTLAPHDIYQDHHDRFAEPPFIAFLKTQEESGPFRVFATDGLLFPNSASAFGLQDIRALDALYVDRYWEFIKQFISPEVTDRFVGGAFSSTEKDTLLLDNPWFDLTGTRYVITSPDATKTGRLLDSPGLIVEQILESVEQSGTTHQDVHVEPVTMAGVTQLALVEDSPDTIRYPVTIDPERAMLQFSIGLRPEVWDSSKGDGVGFQVLVEANGQTESVYDRRIDPKNLVVQRHWFDGDVNLSRYAGQDVVLIFVTDPLTNDAYDWTAWGDIRLNSGQRDRNEQYRRVYNDEVQVFENRHALSRAFLIGDVIAAETMAEASASMRSGFDPRRTAVVEGAPVSQVESLGSADGTATITDAEPGRVTVDVDSPAPSLLILTDVIYPGWVAKLDGDHTPLYPTDLAFRGVFVPSGQHQVQFVYEPASFRTGVAIAIVSGVVFLVVVSGLASHQWYTRQQRRGRELSDA
jgi:hypothetical protein